MMDNDGPILFRAPWGINKRTKEFFVGTHGEHHSTYLTDLKPFEIQDWIVGHLAHREGWDHGMIMKFPSASSMSSSPTRNPKLHNFIIQEYEKKYGDLPYEFDLDPTFKFAVDLSIPGTSAFLYDPATDRFYTGPHHMKIITQNRIPYNWSNNHYVFGWYNANTRQLSISDEYQSPATRQEEAKALEIATQHFKKTAAEPAYVQPYLDSLNPKEIHGMGGDCKNPYCDYKFTPEDKKDMVWAGGWFTCPQCDMSLNYSGNPGQDKITRTGLTPTQMGDIGEAIVEEMANVPGVGPVVWKHEQPQDPLDFIIGDYGIDVKTNHSEAQPRFKIGGAHERAQKLHRAMELGITPGLIGVRLNFYHNNADIFFRPQMSDTWIGQEGLIHIGKIPFNHLNPFKDPSKVPAVDQLPEDDMTDPRSHD